MYPRYMPDSKKVALLLHVQKINQHNYCLPFIIIGLTFIIDYYLFDLLGIFKITLWSRKRKQFKDSLVFSDSWLQKASRIIHFEMERLFFPGLCR